MKKEIKISDYFVFNYNGYKPQKIYGNYTKAMSDAKDVSAKTFDDIYLLQVVAKINAGKVKSITEPYSENIDLKDLLNKLNDKHRTTLIKYEELCDCYKILKQEYDGINCKECKQNLCDEVAHETLKVDDLKEYTKILTKMLNATGELADYYKNKSEQLENKLKC